MRATHLQELLTLSRRDHLDWSLQEEAAHAVAAQLPEPFRFDGLETHALGTLRHRVAFFTWNRWRFALIPGGPATLGYAPGSFQPTPVQQASWEETRRQYFSETSRQRTCTPRTYSTLESFLEPRLTLLRQVTFHPILLQIIAETYHVRGRRLQASPLPPTLSRPLSPAQVKQHLAQEEIGFRLPTSDEWEYACAAGARTLWRWSDEIPMTWMASRKDPEPEWDLHLRSNAFGLLIGDDPRNWEYTAEEQMLCGGDGGTTKYYSPT